jgi:hypothetical protein
MGLAWSFCLGPTGVPQFPWMISKSIHGNLKLFVLSTWRGVWVTCLFDPGGSRCVASATGNRDGDPSIGMHVDPFNRDGDPGATTGNRDDDR